MALDEAKKQIDIVQWMPKRPSPLTIMLDCTDNVAQRRKLQKLENIPLKEQLKWLKFQHMGVHEWKKSVIQNVKPLLDYNPVNKLEEVLGSLYYKRKQYIMHGNPNNWGISELLWDLYWYIIENYDNYFNDIIDGNKQYAIFAWYYYFYQYVFNKYSKTQDFYNDFYVARLNEETYRSETMMNYILKAYNIDDKKGHNKFRLSISLTSIWIAVVQSKSKRNMYDQMTFHTKYTKIKSGFNNVDDDDNDDEEEEEKKTNANIQCKFVEKCVCVHRLSRNMKSFDQWGRKTDFKLSCSLVSLLDDFNHILEFHGDLESQSYFAHIFSHCQNYHHQCRAYYRMNRLYKTGMIILSMIEDPTEVVRIQLIDKVHCFFRHQLELNRFNANKLEEPTSNDCAFDVNATNSYSYGSQINFDALKPVYSSLKQEIFSFSHHFTEKKWKEFEIKTKILMDTAKYKTVKNANGENMSQNHIMAVLLYSDLDELQKFYTQTILYQKNNVENIQKLYHFGAYLKEAVNNFGDLMTDEMRVYHGLNQPFCFHKFCSKFTFPLSTSPYFGAAASFTSLNYQSLYPFVIALKPKWKSNYSLNKTRFLNVSWISDYGHEFEYIFYGDMNELIIDDVIICNVSENTFISHCKYIKCLNYIQRVTDGNLLDKHYNSNTDLSAILVNLTQRIIKNQLTATEQSQNIKVLKLFDGYRGGVAIPLYITQLMNEFCTKKQFVVYQGLEYVHKELTEFFLDRGKVSPNKLKQLFPNATLVANRNDILTEDDEKIYDTVINKQTNNDEIVEELLNNIERQNKEIKQLKGDNSTKQKMLQQLIQTHKDKASILEEKNEQIDILQQENSTLKRKVGDLEDEQKEYEMTINELKQEINTLKRKSININQFKEWEEDEVLNWIFSIENGLFIKYEQKLKEEIKVCEIKGIDLLKVTRTDIKEFGVTKFSDQKTLQEHIEKLKQIDNNQQNNNNNLFEGNIGPTAYISH